ncbi:hypothetical protein [Candidiatus Paracoxiella cheracis]|uniref:hypothetical protein n=1 Tax=Candidiatus Paracoxiella cheracis TaxID=3405120 RepID=UPI003BF464F3
MEWKLNSEEKAALYGKRSVYKALYAFGIRPYMDFKTGIVGVKRKIKRVAMLVIDYCHPCQ